MSGHMLRLRLNDFAQKMQRHWPLKACSVKPFNWEEIGHGTQTGALDKKDWLKYVYDSACTKRFIFSPEFHKRFDGHGWRSAWPI